MTTEDTAQDVLSIRGLQEAFGTPIKKFKGTLESYGVEPDKPAKLNFTDIEIIHSTEPYPYPTCVIEIWPNNKVKSTWGVFGTSLAQLIQPEQDLRDQVGKRFGMEFTSGHMMSRKNKESGEWEEKDIPAWEVFELNGVTAGEPGAAPISAFDRAVSLLQGKAIGDFNKAAMADELVRNDADLLAAIVGKTFASGLVDTGVFTKDTDDVFHKV